MEPLITIGLNPRPLTVPLRYYHCDSNKIIPSFHQYVISSSLIFEAFIQVSCMHLRCWKRARAQMVSFRHLLTVEVVEWF